MSFTMACSPSQRQGQDDGTVGEDNRIEAKLIHPHELAKDLHSQESYFLLDCRPLLAYNTCHITGIALWQLSSVLYSLAVINMITSYVLSIVKTLNIELDLWLYLKCKQSILSMDLSVSAAMIPAIL